MKTVAFHTLGCKVNQYDSQAMLELFEQAGYESRPFHGKADVYVVNTCVVTGEGERKSLQAVRRALKQNPEAAVVLSGCLAQKEAERLLPLGVRLVLGNQRRGEVVALLHQALEDGVQLAAVDGVSRIPYEPLTVARSEGKTRAVMKIQEGCDRYCTYCIIPYVRGTIRSREPVDISREAERLANAGYQEIVLTGIHLSSYGRDLKDGSGLLEAVRRVAAVEGVRRIRLGSLEPVVVDRAFVEGLTALPKLCPQFHLSLQSGSDSVLSRMRRRYTAAEYLEAVRLLRGAFPDCALTTDVLTGFPGETEEEHRETLRFCRQVGFARMHVFPFSAREGTQAARMPGQLSRAVKDARARELIALNEELARSYRESLLHTQQEVLFETMAGERCQGYSPQYQSVVAAGVSPGEIRRVLLEALCEDGFLGRPVN